MRGIGRWMRCWALLALLLSGAGAQRAPVAHGVTLRPTVGGVVVQATFGARDRGGDALLGVWVAGARAKLLSCRPRCKTAESVPVSGTLVLGRQTPYRVVLGGKYVPGQRVGLLFAFRGGVSSAEAVVVRP